MHVNLNPFIISPMQSANSIIYCLILDLEYLTIDRIKPFPISSNSHGDSLEYVIGWEDWIDEWKKS